MRWFIGALLAWTLIDLLFMRRVARGIPHGELLRRGQMQSDSGMLIFLTFLLLGEPWMWLGLAGVPLAVMGFRTINRLTRIQNEEALERWRAKGAPPPLPKYDGTD